MFTMPTDSIIALRNILLQVEKFLAELGNNKNCIYLVESYNDIANNPDKIGAIMHLEGAEAIGRDLELLSLLYRLGLRSMGLTWNYRNNLADGVGEGDNASGLTKYGIKVIKEMDNLGMILDLSHISEKAFFEAFDYYDKPIIASHSNVQRICPHPRNLSDQQLKILGQNGGIIGINQVSFFVGNNNPSINEMIDHIKYIADYIGVEHIALGSDFDGAADIIMAGIEDYRQWEDILKNQGFSAKDIEKILFKNALRVMEEILV